jgi:hypothetical protein
MWMLQRRVARIGGCTYWRKNPPFFLASIVGFTAFFLKLLMILELQQINIPVPKNSFIMLS